MALSQRQWTALVVLVAMLATALNHFLGFGVFGPYGKPVMILTFAVGFVLVYRIRP